MASDCSQKVLKMLNDRLLEAYERYYGNLKIGDMSPKEFIKTYGCIEDRLNSNLKLEVTTSSESTSTSSTNSASTDRSSESSNDSQNVA